MFETIVHQTLQDRENPDHVENHGPFPVEDVKNSYLGYGYYFWDDHIDLAHFWGLCHCDNHYMIAEGILKAKKEILLDLVGSRKDMQTLDGLISTLAQELQNDNIRTFGLGKIVELLKELDKKANHRGIFPYKVIRAVDMTLKTKYQHKMMKFSENKPGMTTLTPHIMICLVEKNGLILPGIKVIYPDEYL